MKTQLIRVRDDLEGNVSGDGDTFNTEEYELESSVGQSVASTISNVNSVSFSNKNSVSTFKRWVHNQNSCVICLEDLDDNVSLLIKCGHAFHGKCIEEWISVNSSDVPCPSCKIPIIVQVD